MTETDVVHTRQGDTIDLICYQHYGYTAGVTEAVMRANPDLCELGPVLPVGTAVYLPAFQPAASKPAVQLWN